MTAYFENGVFTDNRPAWHGMGIVVGDSHLTKERIFELVPEIASPVLQSADLFASYVVNDEVLIAVTNESRANIRLLDGKVLGVVSPTYELVQNDEVFDLGEHIVEAGGLWKTAGTLREGRQVWGLLEIPDAAKIAGEEYQSMLLLTNSFDGSMGVKVLTTDIRVVCANTLAIALNGADRSFSIRHTTNARLRLHEAKAALQLSYSYHEHMRVLGEELAKKKVTQGDVLAMIARVFPYTPEAEVNERKAKRIDERRSDTMTVWMDSPNLVDIRKTAWGFVQAVSEFEQHYSSMRLATSEARFTKVMAQPSMPLTARALEVVNN